jgi:O-acetyl-ADP-ribose deacetylase (regulator of RNase III)
MEMAERRLRIILCDRNEILCDAWRRYFLGVDSVEIVHGDIFALEADAIVSPANSFGFMDGGIDAAYLEHFDASLQPRLQAQIIERGGELLVGEALTLRINARAPRVKWMISAPTMRTPQRILDAQDVRLSTRAALREAIKINARSVILTGMGAGSGAVPPAICAHYMRLGWRDVFEPLPFPATWREAANDHLLVIEWHS